MSKPLAFAALAVALVATIGHGASAASPRSESMRYVMGGENVLVVCGDPVAAVGVGGACFDLDGSESSAFFRVQDDSVPFVGGWYNVRVPPGIVVDAGEFCGAGASFEIHSRQPARLFVHLAATEGPCPDGIDAGPATSGLVIVEFS